MPYYAVEQEHNGWDLNVTKIAVFDDKLLRDVWLAEATTKPRVAVTYSQMCEHMPNLRGNVKELLIPVLRRYHALEAELKKSGEYRSYDHEGAQWDWYPREV